MISIHILQLFCQFVIVAALILQINYQKQKKETIDNYRGFQTMDSKDHPVVP